MGMSQARLQSRLNHTFKNQDLFVQALTHRSANAVNNEKLEFLGDSILNFVMAEVLFQKFPTVSEGNLSRLRASLVKEETLARVAQQLSLGDHLILGQGERKSGGFRRASILSDALEAIIAAIHLDSDLAQAKACIKLWFEDEIAKVTIDKHTQNKDPKTRLQEWLQAKGRPTPDYELLDAQGEAHQQVFKIQCKVAYQNKSVVAEATNRKKAEKKAAEQMLILLGAEKVD